MTPTPVDPVPHVASYYAVTAGAMPQRPALQGHVDADVCIVGAGYTGLSTAIHLAEAGLRVVVLESARVGWGASGRNGGQIVHSYSRDLDVIAQRHGAAQAQALGAMAFEGGAIIRALVARHAIDCDLKDGLLFAALTAKQVGQLEAHTTLWERYGHQQLELLDTAATRAAVRSDRYRGALLDRSAGHLHPLKLALGEAAAVESLGGVIYEGSKVTAIERGTKATVRTDFGDVSASFVVVAGNAYLGNLEPRLAAKSMPCGTQIIATEPLGARWTDVIPSDFCVEDCNFLLDYFRLSADRRLLFGGGVVYGARDLADITASLLPNLLRVFPQLTGVRIDYAWTGNFLLTLSRLPEVGRLDHNIFYSQGCSGHGVTFTHLIGRLLGEVIQGQADRFSAFEKLPHLAFPGGRLLRVPLAAMGAWYYGVRDRLGL